VNKEPKVLNPIKALPSKYSSHEKEFYLLYYTINAETETLSEKPTLVKEESSEVDHEE
jgi:hypothetical protein